MKWVSNSRILEENKNLGFWSSSGQYRYYTHGKETEGQPDLSLMCTEAVTLAHLQLEPVFPGKCVWWSPDQGVQGGRTVNWGQKNSMIERAKNTHPVCKIQVMTSPWVFCADPDPNIPKMTAELLLCPEQSRKIPPRSGAVQVGNWESLRGNEKQTQSCRQYSLPGQGKVSPRRHSSTSLQVKDSWSQGWGKRMGQSSLGWHRLAVGGTGSWAGSTEIPRCWGVRACRAGWARQCWVPAAGSTFWMTQLATPLEQINNGIFWRQAGKCCWLSTALQVKALRCDLCRKLASRAGSVTAEGLSVRWGHEPQSH